MVKRVEARTAQPRTATPLRGHQPTTHVDTTTTSQGVTDPRAVLQLQRTVGNSAVADLLRRQLTAVGTSAAGEAVDDLDEMAVAGGESTSGAEEEEEPATDLSARTQGLAAVGLAASVVGHEVGHARARAALREDLGPTVASRVRSGPGAGSGVAAGLGRALGRIRTGLSVQRCSPKPTPTPRLAKTTVDGPTAATCGGFTWGSRWSINDGAVSNGFVVQHVIWSFDVKDAAGSAVDGPARLGLDPAWTNFWEAWQVRNGSVFVGTTTSPHNADTYSNPGIAGTKGSLSIRGTADYYQIPALPAGFAVRNAAPAWSLPVTNTNPGLTGGTGSLQHDITATWDCTPASTDQASHITTV